MFLNLYIKLIIAALTDKKSILIPSPREPEIANTAITQNNFITPSFKMIEGFFVGLFSQTEKIMQVFNSLPNDFGITTKVFTPLPKETKPVARVFKSLPKETKPTARVFDRLPKETKMAALVFDLLPKETVMVSLGVKTNLINNN